jgi:hypothetical protein
MTGRPIARPIASSPALVSGWKRTESAAISSPKDLSARPANYLTRDRVRALHDGMGPED